MKISVLGGGPAGLYFGILLKKANPAHQITIIERNAPDATFGWGVVFSSETLGALRDADNPSYTEITDTFARWDAIEIRYRGDRLRSRGHAFSAIARVRLLNILRRRCEAMGIELRFETEIHDPTQLATEADLVVAADGVNSTMRRTNSEVFGAKVVPQGGKYVWFGTDLVLDAFTFIFRQTEFGLFQVHSYPFDERTSTFIVECPESTWQQAGLAQMSEKDSIAFCEELFAEDLAGHRLMSNKSIWQNFLNVRNKSWHHGNVVLLGDAAHTAHFSIGSGTKLAMEDAIALASALAKYEGSDGIAAALVDYELQRQPIVERFQHAAGESAGYFQRVNKHTGMEPIQFAFNLLTRSGRISHTSLAVRDPDFVRVLDCWFSGASLLAPPPMFTQLKLGDITLGNRIVRQGTVNQLTDAALDGAGLVLTNPFAVNEQGRVTADSPVLRDDHTLAELAGVVVECHATGSRFALRLGHAGARGATRGRRYGVDLPLPQADSWPLVAASALAYGPVGQVPEELDAAGLRRVRDAFVEAATLAARIGVDILQLDLAHGYLLAGFLSPLTNRRTDRYGGSAAGRLAFPLEVLTEVRSVWPADRLLAVRLTVTDWARSGATIEDGITVATELVRAGVGLIEVAAGQTVAEGRPNYRRGFLTECSDRVRNEAGVPTLLGGYLTTYDDVNTAIGAGRADLCRLDPRPTELDRVVGTRG